MTKNYVELHAHSCYSLLDGVPTPEALVTRAAELDMPALALTDHNNVYGAVAFAQAARAGGVQPMFGAELTLESDEHLTLLVADQQGWSNLCRLISIAQINAPKGQALLTWAALDQHTDGLICLTGCKQGPLATVLKGWDVVGAATRAQWLRERFQNRCYVELQHHLDVGDGPLLRALLRLARDVGLPVVATNNAHYLRRNDQPLHDLLTAIHTRTPLHDLGTHLRANSEYYLKDRARLTPLFTACPEALDASLQIAAQCSFDLHYGLQDLPTFSTPRSEAAGAYLAALCARALPYRYGDPAPTRVCQQLQHELQVIDQVGLSNYLLIVWDIVRFACTHGIRCQGRGSAANALVAYLLGITPIDPLQHDLVFERFLSPEHPKLPDIDLDIAADQREEVIQYVYRTYGSDHAAIACTFNTFHSRSAQRDVAQALDIPLHTLRGEAPTEVALPAPPQHTIDLAQQLCERLHGLPRHLGQHSGGMVLTKSPLHTRVPVEPTAMKGRRVVQWDKDSLETVGLVKIDLLGLRMLSVLSEAEQLLADQGTPVVLDRLAFDDADVYKMIARADTIGVFQVEIRAQASILPLLQPYCFSDLIVAISLIRPGPLQGNMVHPYLRRRQEQEQVSYLHPLVQGALKETLGVILFQEQVLKVARDVAGFTGGQGEQLRRVLGGKYGAARLAQLHDAFCHSAAGRSVGSKVAEQIWGQLLAFGDYAFAKSHAAAFAVVVYQSAWLKYYHPAVFLTALLNNQPMGFWPPTVLVRDARRHNVTVHSLDIATSAWRCTLHGSAVRLGFCYVHGLGEAGAQRITEARGELSFRDLTDLCRRTRLPRTIIETLILAGACDRWGIERRQLVWKLGTLRYTENELELPIPGDAVDLPPLGDHEGNALQAQLLSVSVAEHPLATWRAQLEQRGYVNSVGLGQLSNGQRVRVIGTVLIHQAPPTAKGFHFLTLEDEGGMIGVILRPHIVARYGTERRGGQLVEVEGTVQIEGAVINVLATRLRLRQ